MAIYSITYDLRREKDYKKLEEGIDKISYADWVKPTLSQYIVWSSHSAVDIRKALENYIDSDDILFIVEVDLTNWASHLLPSHLASRIITTDKL